MRSLDRWYACRKKHEGATKERVMIDAKNESASPTELTEAQPVIFVVTDKHRRLNFGGWF